MESIPSSFVYQWKKINAVTNSTFPCPIRWLCDGVPGQGQFGAICPEADVRDRRVPECGQEGDPDSRKLYIVRKIMLHYYYYYQS